MSLIYRADDRAETVIPSDSIRDRRLSFRALGLLTYLLDMPAGGSVAMADIARDRVEGRDALRAARRELEQAGYLVSRSVRGERGRLYTQTWVYRSPQPVADAKPQVAPETGYQAPVHQAPATKPQVAPETGYQAPVHQAPVNQALSVVRRGKDEEEEDAQAREKDQSVDEQGPLADRPVLLDLARALVDVGIGASWPTSPDKLATIERLAVRHGIARLVTAAVQQDANARKRPGRTTAEYVTAFVRRWQSLPEVGPRRAAPPPAATPAGSGGDDLDAVEVAELAELEAALVDDQGVPLSVRAVARKQLVAEGYPVDQMPPRRFRLAILRRAAELHSGAVAGAA